MRNQKGESSHTSAFGYNSSCITTRIKKKQKADAEIEAATSWFTAETTRPSYPYSTGITIAASPAKTAMARTTFVKVVIPLPFLLIVKVE